MNYIIGPLARLSRDSFQAFWSWRECVVNTKHVLHQLKCLLHLKTAMKSDNLVPTKRFKSCSPNMTKKVSQRMCSY